MLKKIKEQIYSATKKMTSSEVEKDISINNVYIDNSTTIVEDTKIIDSVLVRSKVGSSNGIKEHKPITKEETNKVSQKGLNFINLYNYLVDLANSKQKTNYKQVTTDFGLDFVRNKGHLFELLDDIVRYNKENNQPLLAALVVDKKTGKPGPGFFNKWLKVEDYNKELESVFGHKWTKMDISNEPDHSKSMKSGCNPDCPCWGQSITPPRRCPLCGFEFKIGWSGLDGHYNRYHFKDTGVPYQEWKSLMCSEHRPGK